MIIWVSGPKKSQSLEEKRETGNESAAESEVKVGKG